MGKIIVPLLHLPTPSISENQMTFTCKACKLRGIKQPGEMRESQQLRLREYWLINHLC